MIETRMSAKGARKLLGKDARGMTDEHTHETVKLALDVVKSTEVEIE